METETVAPKVCIQCLASYNAGRLIFEWVDATDVDAMRECEKRVAARAVAAAKEAGDWPVYFGPPEEFMLADNEGFGGYLGEYAQYSFVAALATAIEEHGAGFLAYLEGFGRDDIPTDPEEMATDYQDRYRGEWESDEAFARDWVEQAGWRGLEPGSDALEALDAYLDWEAIAREMSIDVYEFNGHYFYAN